MGHGVHSPILREAYTTRRNKTSSMKLLSHVSVYQVLPLLLPAVGSKLHTRNTSPMQVPFRSPACVVVLYIRPK